MQLQITSDFKPFLDTLMGLMLVSEGISILGSIISIKTGREIKNFDLITNALKYLRNMLIKTSRLLFVKMEGRNEDLPNDKEEN